MNSPPLGANKQCLDKVKYGTKREAQEAKARSAQRGIGKLDDYRCPHCEQWHIGHRPPAEVLRRAREARANR